MLSIVISQSAANCILSCASPYFLVRFTVPWTDMEKGANTQKLCADAIGNHVIFVTMEDHLILFSKVPLYIVKQ